VIGITVVATVPVGMCVYLYVTGSQIVSTDVSGTVKDVEVSENQRVTAGLVFDWTRHSFRSQLRTQGLSGPD
jgi:hypothetical protein